MCGRPLGLVRPFPGVVYSHGLCFSISVELLEVLYVWVNRPLDGYLIISFFGLNKFDSP